MKDIVDLAVYYKSCALINGPNKQVHSCSLLICSQAFRGGTKDSIPFRSNSVPLLISCQMNSPRFSLFCTVVHFRNP